jgi:hypothetical protein
VSHRIPLRTTLCPDCKRDIGVQPEFDYDISATGARHDVFRLAVHRNPDKVRCTASRMYIDASAVVPVRREAS